MKGKTLVSICLLGLGSFFGFSSYGQSADEMYDGFKSNLKDNVPMLLYISDINGDGAPDRMLGMYLEESSTFYGEAFIDGDFDGCVDTYGEFTYSSDTRLMESNLNSVSAEEIRKANKFERAELDAFNGVLQKLGKEYGIGKHYFNFNNYKEVATNIEDLLKNTYIISK